MASLLRTHLRLARASVRKNRTRSFLTCLGVAIGVASIILILSLTGSISNLISQEVADIGADLIVVRPNSTKDVATSIIEELTSSNTFQKSNLTLSDVEAIAGLDHVKAAAPIALSSNTITNEDNTIASAIILGTTPDFFAIEPLTLRYGAFLTPKNQDTSVIIGHALSLKLFNTSNPVGRTLFFRGQRFIVIGVLDVISESINFDNVDFDNALIMSAPLLEQLIGGIQIQQINVRVSNTDSLASVASAITDTVTSRNDGDTNFSVTYGDNITHPASSLLNIVSGMLALVAGISLIVGGIGIMNVMLVSVSERTHEIGIRKAVGASSTNILMQFLLESAILSISGGFLGIVFGYILAFLVSIVTPFIPYISWEIIAITFLTAIVTGLIFGIYPALKAASKSPIDSLRYYR